MNVGAIDVTLADGVKAVALGNEALDGLGGRFPCVQIRNGPVACLEFCRTRALKASRLILNVRPALRDFETRMKVRQSVDKSRAKHSGEVGSVEREKVNAGDPFVGDVGSHIDFRKM